MKLNIELDRRADGAWMARVLEMPGIRAIGEDRVDAFRRVQARALRLLAARLELGDAIPDGGPALELAFTLV